MFGLEFSEILIVFFVALIVFGPKALIDSLKLLREQFFDVDTKISNLRKEIEDQSRNFMYTSDSIVKKKNDIEDSIFTRHEQK